MSINVIFTAENRKYMHIDFAINVIQTAKYRKYRPYSITRVKITPKVFLRVQEEQGAFTERFSMRQ